MCSVFWSLNYRVCVFFGGYGGCVRYVYVVDFIRNDNDGRNEDKLF